MLISVLRKKLHFPQT